MIKNLVKKCSTILSDEAYIKIRFLIRMHKPLNLKNPKTMNEKLQWLKLNDRKEIYQTLVDKYEVKKYVADIIGEEYVIPTLGVWDSFDDIDFDSLPEKFVLKCTHDSGGCVICHDKKTLDMDKAKEKINKSLNSNYYYLGREWPYKNLKHRIIAEPYYEDYDGAGTLTDYKIYCFGGKSEFIKVCIERDTGHTKYYFFDKDWKLKRCNKYGLEAPEDFTLPKPENLEKMLELATKMSKDLTFIRVDLYSCNNKIYFGEYTFYPWSGFCPDFTEEFDLSCGEMINLDVVK